MRSIPEYVRNVSEKTEQEQLDALIAAGDVPINATLKFYRVPCDFLAEVVDKTGAEIVAVASPTSPALSRGGYRKYRKAIVDILTQSATPLGISTLACILENRYNQIWLELVAQEGSEKKAVTRLRRVVRPLLKEGTLVRHETGGLDLATDY
jgi:hypothetical protein